MSLTYDQLLAFVRTHAGIRAVTALEPLGGPGTKVFPPTYGVDDPAPVTRYAVEERIITDAEGGQTRVVESVVLNSVAAQAHAFSDALLSAWKAGDLELPLVGVDFRNSAGLEDFGVITDLELPHRVYDAIARDSLDGDVPFRFGLIGKAVTGASRGNATALFLYAPWHCCSARGTRLGRREGGAASSSGRSPARSSQPISPWAKRRRRGLIRSASKRERRRFIRRRWWLDTRSAGGI